MYTRNSKSCTRVGPWKHAHAQVKSSLTESFSHFYHRPNTQIHSSNSWKRTWTRFVVNCSCSRSRSCSWYWYWWTVLKTWKAERGNEKRTGRPGEESSPLTPHVFRVTLFLRFFLFPSQIKAYVDCGKLKSAYLIAVKEDRVEAIQEIAETAMKTGQSKIVEICKKWLSQYQKRREVQERSVTQRRRTNNR